MCAHLLQGPSKLYENSCEAGTEGVLKTRVQAPVLRCRRSSGPFLILYHGYNLRRKCLAVLKRRLFFRKVFELRFDYDMWRF